ncbi:MAG: rnhA operon protein [Halobacteria archaeon]|nr:rnhA operon protein [Halobacteria archaeon]
MVDENSDTEDVYPERDDDWVRRAAKLTRLARYSEDEDELLDERDEMVEERGYRARVREEDSTLVLYPDDWVEDGEVVVERIDDTDEAVEVPLRRGGEEYDDVRDTNDEILGGFEEEFDEKHFVNARAFAEFCENHHTVPVERVTAEHVDEFLAEYYPRNVWVHDETEEVVEESLRLLLDYVDTDTEEAKRAVEDRD